MEKLRSLVANLAIAIVALALIIILFRQLSSDAVYVEPIEVPATLAALGYTPEVTAGWILDDMLKIQSKALTRKHGQYLAPEWERFDIEVPGSGITLSTLGLAIRQSLGLRERKVSGELVATETGYQLRIRFSGGARFQQPPVFGSKQDVDTMIHSAAEQAVQLIAPFMFASYLHASNRLEELEEAIRFSLENGPAEDRKWAYNLRGIMLAEQNKLDEAVESYANALQEDKRFALAYHNMANALYEQGKYDLALKNLLLAVSWDSSLHDGSKEARFRFSLGKHYGRDPERRDDEIEMYRLARKSDPEEIQALMYWGIALMKEPDPDFEAASKKFAEYTLKDNSAPEVYVKWGQALEGMREYQKAIEKYEAAMDIDPEGYGYLEHKIDLLRSPVKP